MTPRMWTSCQLMIDIVSTTTARWLDFPYSLVLQPCNLSLTLFMNWNDKVKQSCIIGKVMKSPPHYLFLTYLHPLPYQEKPVVPMLVGYTSFLGLHMVRIKWKFTEDIHNYTKQNRTLDYISNMQKDWQREKEAICTSFSQCLASVWCP